MTIKHRLSRYFGWLLIPAVILSLWWLATQLHLVSPVLLPSPGQVWLAAVNLLQFGYNGTPFWEHYLLTLRRVTVAVVLAVMSGTPLGLLSAYHVKTGQFIDPIIQFLRPIPPLAYYTLLILWLGIGESSKILLLFLAALPPIYLAAYDAVSSINLDYRHNAASLGANSRQIFTRIVFPAALPGIMTGIRSAVGMAYTTIVSAEMIASTSGIGWMVIDASHYLKSDVMIVDIIVMGLTGVLLDWLLKRFGQHFIKWQGRS